MRLALFALLFVLAAVGLAVAGFVFWALVAAAVACAAFVVALA